MILDFTTEIVPAVPLNVEPSLNVPDIVPDPAKAMLRVTLCPWQILLLLGVKLAVGDATTLIAPIADGLRHGPVVVTV